MISLVHTKSFSASSAGLTTLLSPRSSAGRLMIFSILYNVNADVTGEVKLFVGDTLLSGALNPKTGALYGFNHNPNYLLGGVGDPVKISLPSATATTIDITWKETPDYSMTL